MVAFFPDKWHTLPLKEVLKNPILPARVYHDGEWRELSDTEFLTSKDREGQWLSACDYMICRMVLVSFRSLIMLLCLYSNIEVTVTDFDTVLFRFYHRAKSDRAPSDKIAEDGKQFRMAMSSKC